MAAKKTTARKTRTARPAPGPMDANVREASAAAISIFTERMLVLDAASVATSELKGRSGYAVRVKLEDGKRVTFRVAQQPARPVRARRGRQAANGNGNK